MKIFFTLFLFFCIIYGKLWSQKVYLISGNTFVLPSNSLPIQFIKTDSGYFALFQNQKITGAYQFFLVNFNTELEFQYKLELENASTEFYNNLDYENDTLRVFSAKSNLINNQNIVEYGYRIFDFKQKNLKPAYKKLAVREALPNLSYSISDNSINPYQYHLVKLDHFYHLYYFQKKKVKSIDYTYICVKIFDKYFNIVNYYQKEITPFENLFIENIFKKQDTSGMDLKIVNKNLESTSLFYHILTKDSLWISEISTKKFFQKHYLLDKNQSIGILGSEKPEYAYFLNSNSPKDSLILESIFGNFKYNYRFSFYSQNMAYFPYISKDLLFSIHNLYVTNLYSKKNVMLPYYISTDLENELYVCPVFWENLCLINGKLNSKNYFQLNQNQTYTIWNFERQSITQEFFFNEPFALMLQFPFLKNETGAFFIGKNKDRFMIYHLEIKK
jgi:hypothetical protein